LTLEGTVIEEAAALIFVLAAGLNTTSRAPST